ncbi:hypothetical protein PBI_PEREGRIN_276 [Rhodococcus phage Peregrin]|jgi:hypothetical protein|nr:hypothetical protein PBI_PEREGRIN_276 [Rhodococcus phage Peregrin]
MALYNGIEESNPQFDALQAQLDAEQSNADAYLSNNGW